MPVTINSAPFAALAAALAEGGYTEHSRRLESVLNGTWTSSSELIAELGQVVLSVRKECKPLNPSQRALVNECLRQVRTVWPGLGRLSWLRILRNGR